MDSLDALWILGVKSVNTERFRVNFYVWRKKLTTVTIGTFVFGVNRKEMSPTYNNQILFSLTQVHFLSA